MMGNLKQERAVDNTIETYLVKLKGIRIVQGLYFLMLYQVKVKKLLC